MKKIPTLFVRDYDSRDRHVINEVNPGCEWVIEGEGVATRKYDGACTRIHDGKFYKRREVKPGKAIPEGFEAAGPADPVTGKLMGWMEVGDGPEDKFFREAFINSDGANLPDGTFEAIGPKFQGNPEGTADHRLVSHDRAEIIEDAPRDFAGLMEFLRGIDYEGIVWHRASDNSTAGDMVKLKKRDLPRQ